GGAAIGRLLLLLGLHPPDDPADVARGNIDLVEHAPTVGDVEKAVLHQWRCMNDFHAGPAAERHRVSEPQSLDVAFVYAGEWRETLAVVAAMVHQPVLRLFVRIEEPLCRDLSGQGRNRDGEHAARQQRDADRTVALCHECLPCDGALPPPFRTCLRSGGCGGFWSVFITVSRGGQANGEWGGVSV